MAYQQWSSNRVRTRTELASLYPGTGYKQFLPHSWLTEALQLPVSNPVSCQRSCHCWLEAQGYWDMKGNLILLWKWQWACWSTCIVGHCPSGVCKGFGSLVSWAPSPGAVLGAPLLVISVSSRSFFLIKTHLSVTLWEGTKQKMQSYL